MIIGLIFSVYAVSGVLSAVAGLINLGVTNSANADYGASYVLLAILISVLGGILPRTEPAESLAWFSLF